MDKNEFLIKLEKALAHVPESDRKEIRYDYEEHFRNASAAGKTETEIINSLGDPEIIAKQYLAGYSGKIADRSILNIVKLTCLQSAMAKVRRGFINFRERISGNTLTFGLITALLVGILILEIFVFIHQNQFLESQKNYQHQNLVAVIKGYQRKAKFNQGAFAPLLKIAEKAQYNKDAIKRAGYIIANVGFHTVPVLKIAQIAGNADREVEHIKELLELTIIYSDSLTMVELAKKAVNDVISEAELEAAIKYYRDHSSVKTIEEAEKNMEKTLENL